MVSETASRLIETNRTAMGFSPNHSYDLGRLHMEVTGPEGAPSVLLLHGWGSCASHMRVIAHSLQNTYRIYNIDLPGHGQSPTPPVALGIPEHADLISRLIEDQSLDPLTIIGHSNGGRVAIFMSSDSTYCHLVKNLVLISPSGIAPIRTWKYYVRTSVARILKAPIMILPARLQALGLDWLRHTLVWRALGSSDYRSLEGVMRETFVKTVNCHLDDVVDRISVPTLIFWGDQDEAVSLHQMQVLSERIPDAGLVVLEGAGHYGYLDDFETFIAATRHFLDACSTS